MHAPPRLALLAALGLIALFPSLPLGSSVVAGDQNPDALIALDLCLEAPAAARDLELDLALVSAGQPWTGALARYRPDQALLLPPIHAPCDVLLRSSDGLWAGRARLAPQPSGALLPIRLQPRGILSGIVLDSKGRPLHCLVQAQTEGQQLRTIATQEDGTFRFAWLPEGKYRISSPLTANGRGITSAIAIAGQEIHIRLQPQPTQGPAAKVVGHVRSRTGAYRKPLRVRLLPVDVNASPTDAEVVWQAQQGGIIQGSFELPATLGEQYFVRVQKDDQTPAVYDHSPILAPHQDFVILCDDASQRTTLKLQPQVDVGAAGPMDFEVALTWGEGVIWRNTSSGSCTIEGLPTGVPVHWMVQAANTAPAYGTRVFQPERSHHSLRPSLRAGWGEGLHLVFPDGTPAAHVHVLLDGVPAGRSDAHGLLTVHGAAAPTRLSLHADHMRVFGGEGPSRLLTDLKDRDELGRLLLVLLPRS